MRLTVYAVMPMVVRVYRDGLAMAMVVAANKKWGLKGQRGADSRSVATTQGGCSKQQ